MSPHILPVSMPASLLALALASFLLAGCGGDGGLEEAGEELAHIQEEVEAKQAMVEAREEEAEEAREALAEARKELDVARKRLAAAKQEVAEVANDAVLFRAVQQRLLDSDALAGVAVSARVEERVVTLDGSVPSEQLKQRAEEIAAGTVGVETVINRVTVEVAAKKE